MKNYNVIKAILGGVWAIDPAYELSLRPIVDRILEGDTKALSTFFDDEEEKEKPFASVLTLEGNVFKQSYYTEDIKPGSLFMLEMRGPIAKETDCGVAGTADVMKQVLEMSMNPNIIGGIMVVDSPGGQVDGTFELADALAAVGNGKPFVGFADGHATSAGYAILSGCKEIYAAHKSTTVGSIGTMATLMDRRGSDEKYGVKRLYFNAATSPDKNKEVLEALDGKGQLLIKKLTELNAVFLETVQKYRPGADASTLTGKTYLAEEAQSLGLIDGISTLGDAINRAYELATHKN